MGQPRYVCQVEHEDYSRVSRPRLDDDRLGWPTPPGPKLRHHGVIERDGALDPPDGYRWINAALLETSLSGARSGRAEDSDVSDLLVDFDDQADE